MLIVQGVNPLPKQLVTPSLKYRLLMRKCSSSQPISPLKRWCFFFKWWTWGKCFVAACDCFFAASAWVDWEQHLFLGGLNFFVLFGVIHICLDLPGYLVGWYFWGDGKEVQHLTYRFHSGWYDLCFFPIGGVGNKSDMFGSNSVPGDMILEEDCLKTQATGFNNWV